MGHGSVLALEGGCVRWWGRRRWFLAPSHKKPHWRPSFPYNFDRFGMCHILRIYAVYFNYLVSNLKKIQKYITLLHDKIRRISFLIWFLYTVIAKGFCLNTLLAIMGFNTLTDKTAIEVGRIFLFFSKTFMAVRYNLTSLPRFGCKMENGAQVGPVRSNLECN